MRTVHAEWTKLRTLPSTGWLLLGAVGLTIALSAAVAGSADARTCPRCLADPTELSLFGVRLGQVALVALATLAVSAEYTTRLILVTFAANPRRLTVYAAKLGIVGAASLFAGACGAVGSWLVGRRLVELPLDDAASMRAVAGTALYCGLIGLLSAGLAAALRDTAAAITVTLALLYLAPIVAMFVSNPLWERRLQQLSPMDAGLTIQATRGLESLAIQPWQGLAVLAAYAGVSVGLGGLLLRLRDA